ncbi:MAG TPA: bifunctional precorrin-2 dehydrogenase/sirohydrochlorin ferrochelatase [Terriglobales bacterium]|nr:bifunctional precorrin-2 dehydrogenase/sirohydrochlorin ferrochelatase [Terriglobales bacterium]
MALYPIFLKLQGHKVLIVGGGRIAEEKAEAVLRSATDLTVLAPRITDRLQRWAEQGLLKHIPQEYRPGSARGYFLVIAATGSEQVNGDVYREAREDGALCNAVDDPGHCDFYAPAVVRRGDFQIAISTGGHSPALAQQVRKDLEKQFGPEYGAFAAWLGRMRAGLRSALPASSQRMELLRLLTFCKPNRIQSNIESCGGSHGQSNQSRIGGSVETSG